jgi:tripartite-type tricarboxylate transporter receptor subunit TctC
LRTEFGKVVAMPEVAELFAKTGGKVLKLSLAETEALLRQDVERWTKLVKDAGISAAP